MTRGTDKKGITRGMKKHFPPKSHLIKQVSEVGGGETEKSTPKAIKMR